MTVNKKRIIAKMSYMGAHEGDCCAKTIVLFSS